MSTTRPTNNVGIAFALTCAAGFATVLGATVVFSKRLMHLANPVTLAIALSVSAGVMIFISFVEIFGKAVEAIETGLKNKSNMSDSTAKGHGLLITTTCFGIGILLIYVIDYLVHKMAPEHADIELDNLEHISPEVSRYDHENNWTHSTTFVESHTPGSKMDEQSRQRLQRMGLISALAIGLHNIPEGVATYVATVENPAVGASLAIGIGLHNIPEGIAVAAPVYFATGSRWRAIMWTTISALAEPFGGFLAWIAIGNGMNPTTQGILFGVVCGLMVAICIKELWPTAYRFAAGKTEYVALGSFAGMFIMVTSLILFGYAGV